MSTHLPLVILIIVFVCDMGSIMIKLAKYLLETPLSIHYIQCFKRRSANPSDDFQEALKQAMQAIKKKETKQGIDSS
ncbi:hypothetical protein DCAR_0519015 [Daucus carota subsp. sativus]|uniref:Uncharacterized protein n=1 Tax=Daucus carota subsp. sativus TaxID=79200 RepID=A0A164XND3_DAUCS|nr:hypothetical protein DCAR_0519015 [Daucus carota subsp. sativus]